MHYRLAPGVADAVAGLPDRDVTHLAATRAAMHADYTAVPVDTEGLEVEDITVPGWSSEPDVRIRLVRPAARPAAAVPAILHIHGGGFVMGDLENSHARLCNVVRRLGVLAVSVDYRLAPEHPYPAALHDVLAALHWLDANTGPLGVEPDLIAIHGISAGAGLAAAVTQFVRDHGGPALCFQYLAMPSLDDRLSTPSMRGFGDTPGWNTSKARLTWEAYLGAGVPGRPGIAPYAAPARATDLSELPPAYIGVMEFDPLRDEGIAYAQALLAAGVSVELHLFPGTFHGSANLTAAPITQRELAEEVTVLGAALARPVPASRP